MKWYTYGMAVAPSTMVPLGTAAPPFVLPDMVSGATISLETFADKKALLVMFLCRHCTYVQHVKQALTALGQEYQGTELGIVAISANDATAYAQDAPASLKAMAVAEAFTFLCWLHGISVRESAVCTSTISYSSHFALLKFMELSRRWRTALSIFSKHA